MLKISPASGHSREKMQERARQRGREREREREGEREGGALTYIRHESEHIAKQRPRFRPGDILGRTILHLGHVLRDVTILDGGVSLDRPRATLHHRRHHRRQTRASDLADEEAGAHHVSGRRFSILQNVFVVVYSVFRKLRKGKGEVGGRATPSIRRINRRIVICVAVALPVIYGDRRKL